MEVIILLVSIIGAHMSKIDFVTLHFYITLAFALYKNMKLTNELLRSKKDT